MALWLISRDVLRNHTRGILHLGAKQTACDLAPDLIATRYFWELPTISQHELISQAVQGTRDISRLGHGTSPLPLLFVSICHTRHADLHERGQPLTKDTSCRTQLNLRERHQQQPCFAPQTCMHMLSVRH